MAELKGLKVGIGRVLFECVLGGYALFIFKLLGRVALPEETQYTHRLSIMYF